MPTIDTLAPVGKLVADNIGRAKVFELWGIDFCCGGGKSLGPACEENGVSLPLLLADLERVDRIESGEGTDWTRASLTELADHIVGTHHEYLRGELPRLTALGHKVADAHGDLHPELKEISGLVERLGEEMDSHSRKEEMILFPFIREMEFIGAVPRSPFGKVENPISMMELEHDEAGGILVRLRELTHGFEAPADSCASYRSLYDRLNALEKDLHIHIHKENNILFPRTLQLEAQLCAA